MKGNMELAEARTIAETIMRSLEPHCDRIEIAGSIRREKAVIGDIEIVCIPRRVTVVRDMFDTDSGDIVQPCAGFVQAVGSIGTTVKGLPYGKYTQRVTADGVAVDLFMTQPDNWGHIFAIRTGSADFSHRVLATRWVKWGYKSEGGILTHRDGTQIRAREERELFEALGLDWVEPKERH